MAIAEAITQRYIVTIDGAFNMDSENMSEIKEEVKQVKEEIKEAVRDEKVLGKQLPENVEKLVNFMEETGGTVEDYV